MNDPLQVPNFLMPFNPSWELFVIHQGHANDHHNYHANDHHILSGKYGPHWVSTESFPLPQLECL